MQVETPSEGVLIFRAFTKDECQVLNKIEELFWATQLIDPHKENSAVESVAKCYKAVTDYSMNKESVGTENRSELLW